MLQKVTYFKLCVLIIACMCILILISNIFKYMEVRNSNKFTNGFKEIIHDDMSKINEFFEEAKLKISINPDTSDPSLKYKMKNLLSQSMINYEKKSLLKKYLKENEGNFVSFFKHKMNIQSFSPIMKNEIVLIQLQELFQVSKSFNIRKYINSFYGIESDDSEKTYDSEDKIEDLHNKVRGITTAKDDEDIKFLKLYLYAYYLNDTKYINEFLKFLVDAKANEYLFFMIMEYIGKKIVYDKFKSIIYTIGSL